MKFSLRAVLRLNTFSEDQYRQILLLKAAAKYLSLADLLGGLLRTHLKIFSSIDLQLQEATTPVATKIRTEEFKKSLLT